MKHLNDYTINATFEISTYYDTDDNFYWADIRTMDGTVIEDFCGICEQDALDQAKNHLNQNHIATDFHPHTEKQIQDVEADTKKTSEQELEEHANQIKHDEMV